MTDVGRREERREVIQPEPAEAVSALLDADLPDLEREGLPLLWHWFHLLDRPRQQDLGIDGHPLTGSIVEPPAGGRRRMWAGGRVRRLGPLVVGRTATRRSEVASTTDKVGASGPLTFVVVRHVIEQDGRVVVEEEQDLVYREEAVERTGETTAPDATTATDGAWEVPVDPVLLFRFSALTYNAHRIHYDRDYSRDVERYPGLVVHGPLQALAMAECARRSGARGRLEMSYRLVSPLFDGQGMFADVETGPGGWSTRIADRSGRTTARGVVSTIPSA